MKDLDDCSLNEPNDDRVGVYGSEYDAATLREFQLVGVEDTTIVTVTIPEVDTGDMELL